MQRSKLLVEAMDFCPGAEDMDTMDCALEVSELFGFIKRKLDLPLGANAIHIDPTK